MKGLKIFLTATIVMALSFMPALAKSDNRYGITIDGKFKDWAKYPKQTISFDYNNNNVNKEGAFLRDGETLYLYIDMHPKQTSGLTHTYVNIQTHGHELNIDGEIFYPYFKDVHQYANQLAVGQSAPFSVGYYSNSGEVIVGKGMQTRVNENGAEHDIVEVSMSLGAFVKNPKNVKTVTFKSNNLGQQTFTFTGTPTGAYGLALIGFGFAAVALVVIHRKQRV